MARKKYQDEDDQEPYFPRARLNLKSGTRQGVAMILFLALAVIFILSLTGQAGTFGQIANKVLKLAFGWMAYGVPVIFILMAAALFRQKEQDEKTVSTHAYVGGVLLTLTLTGFLHLLVIKNNVDQAFALVSLGRGGGYLGLLTAFPLIHLMGFVASLVLILAGILVSLMVTFNVSFKDLFKPKSEESKLKSTPLKINNGAATGFVNQTVSEANRRLAEEKLEPVINLPQFKTAGPKRTVVREVVDRDWKFPSLDLLEESKTKVDSGNIEMNVSIIQKTLADFGIEVEMGEVNVGPTVTQYTLRPAIGVKLSQIASLQNDLALALAASSIRMELPIPGKSLVGVEIPNKAAALVRLKEILASSQLSEHPSKLAFALGRDVAGHPMVSDLSRMPHLLIAGATGTGKSVAISSMLLSFLFRTTPQEVKFIIIDPKRVELSLYNNLPHLLTSVIIDHQQAVNALKWTVSEMDRRYKLLSEVHKRNIAEYNQSTLIRLPYLVIVVDELADLMSVAQNEVEAAIVRLAQMARAVGIHLVVATQRPSVDVITGLIKANITARIAFAVASQVDSRTILDISGAEKLLGMGDMLYVTAELTKPKRIQGTFVSEKEIKRVTDFLRSQAGSIIYDDQIVRRAIATSINQDYEGLEEDEGLIEEAVELVQNAGKASASLLQRRLRLGYARAARILDILEERRIVGPAEGAKPREVYHTSGRQTEEEEVENFKD